MELTASMIKTYAKIAKTQRGFVVVARHRATAPAMMGGRVPQTMEAAQTSASKFDATTFPQVWIVDADSNVTEVAR